jgi:hypothetical protein
LPILGFLQSYSSKRTRLVGAQQFSVSFLEDSRRTKIGEIDFNIACNALRREVSVDGILVSRVGALVVAISHDVIVRYWFLYLRA